jgi:hypothetical protein
LQKSNKERSLKINAAAIRLQRVLAKRGGVKWSKFSRIAKCSDHLGRILGQTRLLATIFRKIFCARAALN